MQGAAPFVCGARPERKKMTLGQRLWVWYCPSVPAVRLRLLRAAVGGYALIYLLARAGHLNAVVAYPESSFTPVGIARVLETPLASGWVYASYAASVLAGGFFVCGIAYRWSAPLFAVLLLWVTSYRHSFGMIFHTDNLLVLHVLLLSLAPAGGPLSGRAGASSSAADQGAAGTAPGWVLRVMAIVTVAAYVVAGAAKLQHTGLAWAAGEALREQIAYDAIRKIELGSISSPIGPWLLPHGWLFTPLSAFSLATELLAPLALLGARPAAVWSACAWLFHAGVLALMAIAFPYPLSGVAFLAFFPLERALPSLERARSRLRRPAAPTEHGSPNP
jgi:hypothetical protein